MLLLDEPGVVRVFFEEEPRLQVHEWFEYNPEDRDWMVVRTLDRIYQLLLDHPVASVLVKANQTRGAFSPEIQKYLREVQFPRLIRDTPLRFVATVESADRAIQMGAELWKGQFEEGAPLILHDVETEAEGRAWLQTMVELSRRPSQGSSRTDHRAGR